MAANHRVHPPHTVCSRQPSAANSSALSGASPAGARLPTTPLFLQALGLVAATLAAVFLATALVVINLPPPSPDVYTVSEVAQAIRTGKTFPTVEGRALEVRPVSGPPSVTAPLGRRHINFRMGLAQPRRHGHGGQHGVDACQLPPAGPCAGTMDGSGRVRRGAFVND